MAVPDRLSSILLGIVSILVITEIQTADAGNAIPVDLGCSPYLEVGWAGPDLVTGAIQEYPEAFGIYRREFSLHNGRAWYRGTANTERVIYLASNGNWHIGPEESIGQGWSNMFQSGDSECPGNHDSWSYFVENGPGIGDDDWIADSAVTIKHFSNPIISKIDGQWGPWSRWSSCTRTCGGGRTRRTRRCDSPAPSNGGDDCEGGVVSQSIACNTAPCPDLFETCAGCPSPAEVDRDIVDFAVSELEGGFGSVCLRNVLLVQTFSTQVVAGSLYKFDLVLRHDNTGTEGCVKDNGEEESCHVEVWEKTWENFREVQWDSTTCRRY